VRGELLLAVIGGAFCIFVIGWSTVPVLIATGACLLLFALLYLPLSRRRYLLPDATVRTGEFARLRERHDDPQNK
jgi:hypothetical protein